MSLTIGDVAPAFDLPGDGGGRVSSEALKGKPFVLYFYPKDDTTGCTREALDFTGLADDFAEIATPVIGVSKDSPKSHDKFKAKHGLNLILASDEEGVTCEAYGVWVEKSMYGRKYMGIERATFLVGADGTLREIWRKVSVPQHAEAVLRAAKAIAG